MTDENTPLTDEELATQKKVVAALEGDYNDCTWAGELVPRLLSTIEQKDARVAVLVEEIKKTHSICWTLSAENKTCREVYPGIKRYGDGDWERWCYTCQFQEILSALPAAAEKMLKERDALEVERDKLRNYIEDALESIGTLGPNSSSLLLRVRLLLSAALAGEGEKEERRVQQRRQFHHGPLYVEKRAGNSGRTTRRKFAPELAMTLAGEESG